MGGKFTVELEFWVVSEEHGTEPAAGITLVNTDFEFSALINNMTLGAQLIKVKVD